MKAPTGFGLVELLVASVCAGLLSTAVFALLVGTAQTARTRLGRLQMDTLAAACADSVVRDVRRAGRGLEGAVIVRAGGARIPVIEPLPAGLRLTLAEDVPVEVVPLGGGRYRHAGRGGLDPGVRVAALGTTDPPEPLLGVIVQAGPLAGGPGWGIRVRFAASEAAALAAESPVRAVIPVSVREFRFEPAAGAGFRLRRRDDGGPWQPVLEAVHAWRLLYGTDADGDGAMDATPGPAAALASGATVVVVGVECAAAAAGEPPRTAWAWGGPGG